MLQIPGVPGNSYISSKISSLGKSSKGGTFVLGPGRTNRIRCHLLVDGGRIRYSAETGKEHPQKLLKNIRRCERERVDFVKYVEGFDVGPS